MTSGLGFATEVGRLPQQTGCLRTLKDTVRVRGQSSDWGEKKEEEEEKKEEERKEKEKEKTIFLLYYTHSLEFLTIFFSEVDNKEGKGYILFQLSRVHKVSD